MTNKKWHEDSDMVGCPVQVKDEDYEDWTIDLFKEYIKGIERPFICKHNFWKYAKPVKPEDCYQGR